MTICNMVSSCAGRRMAQSAAHLVAQVIPWVPTRQWVVSVPVPVRYWMAASQDLTAQIHTIIRTTIAQYYVNKAVARGFPPAERVAKNGHAPGERRNFVAVVDDQHVPPIRSDRRRCHADDVDDLIDRRGRRTIIPIAESLFAA